MKNFISKFLYVLEYKKISKTKIKIFPFFFKFWISEIIVKKNKAFISGNTNFQAAELMSSDLRASVALVLAATVATGSSTINRIYHLDRGYENIEKKLKKVGAKIRRIN